jgi:archaemetzincin
VTRVVMQPLMPAPNDADLEAARRAIVAFFDVEVAMLAAEPLPASAYYAPRKRHRAEKLLLHLAAKLTDEERATTKIVGVTSLDISTTKGDVFDWGIMGLGDIDGPACVVSRHRCAKTARSAAHARERLMKVVVHELGHTFGSPHCDVVGCLMNDANGGVKPVDDETGFCPSTRALFRAHGVRVLEDPSRPW